MNLSGSSLEKGIFDFMLVATKHQLKKQRVISWLSELKTASNDAVSIYLPKGLPLPEIEKKLSIVLSMEPVLTDIASEIAQSTTGAALYWGEQYRYLVLPPFPITENLTLQGYDVEHLRLLLEQDLTIALVLVRMGAYAIGIFQNERLLSSKIGTGLVHARHRQGGSSQHRFERHRDKQIELFFSRVCAHAREKLGPYLQQLDYLYYGGERFTIHSFREQCQFLKRLDDRVLERLLNVREPKQASLETAIDEVWSSQVIQWQKKQDE
jgi:hypothetical protein